MRVNSTPLSRPMVQLGMWVPGPRGGLRPFSRRLGVTLTCETCGAAVYRKPSEVGQRVFCSQGCRRRRQQVACVVCGILFERHDCRIETKHHICGAACREKWRGAGSEIACATCGRKVWRRPSLMAPVVYCSHRCRAVPQRRDAGQEVRRRLRANFSSRIGRSLKDGKVGRSWENLAGYTVEDLMRHLEVLLLPGMNWSNYGFRGWHIDHIRPVASFRYDSYDHPQFRECWSLSNLQPLWAVDNLRKRDKWVDDSA